VSDLHPQCREVIRITEGWPMPEVPTLADVRASEEWRQRDLAGRGPDMHEVRELTLPGPAGEVPAVLYRPTGDVAPGLLVWLHGGGWAVGSPASSDDEVRALAQASGCAVLSVDYRLAPEHRFPSGLEDGYAAIVWAAAHAERLGARPGRLAVGGGSAGGNLTAAATLIARDRGGPRIDYQVMFYPATCRHLDDAPSRTRYAEGYWTTQGAIDWFWDGYLADPADASNPYASPLLAESLAGLPPALILLPECDVLHDEGVQYARRLEQAGVPVDLRVHEGMLHGWLVCGAVVESAWETLREAGETLGAALAVDA
jgi:acetyl esterase